MDYVLLAPLLALFPAFCMARLRRDGVGLVGGGLLTAGASLKGVDMAHAAGVYTAELFYTAMAAASLAAAAAGAALWTYYKITGRKPPRVSQCPLIAPRRLCRDRD